MIERRNWLGCKPLCHLGILFVFSFVGITPSEAQIVLNVQPGATPNQVVLSWSGGTPPYNLYMDGSPDLTGGVEALLANTFLTTYTAAATGDLVFFRVGDSTAPQVTITSPMNGSSVSTGHLSVAGTTTISGASVWVSRKQAQVIGTSFTANDVLLALGPNTLHASATTNDGNVFVATSDVTRLAGNDPPIITIIFPLEGGLSVEDVTPLMQVSYSDTDPLWPSGLEAYLDGINQTSKFVKNPTTGPCPAGDTCTATWQLADGDALIHGDHTLRVTMQDSDGYINSATSQFLVWAPRLFSVVPNMGLPLSTISLNGRGFASTNNTHVYFNGLEATIQSLSDTQIQVTAPANVTDGPVKVVVNGVESESQTFDVAFTIAGNSSYEVAIDALDRVYYVDQTRHRVMRIDQAGVETQFYPPTGTLADQITGMGFDPAGTTLYVVSRGNPSYQGTLHLYLTGRITSVDQNGIGTLRMTLPADVGPFSDPGGVDVKPPLLYTGAFRRDIREEIVQISMSSWSVVGSPVLFGDGPNVLSGVKLDSVGNIYSIWQPTGAQPRLYQNSTLVYSTGVLVDLAIDCLDRVYFTDFGGDVVLRRTGAITEGIEGFAGLDPEGIDIDSKGNVFVGTTSSVRRIQNEDYSCTNDFTVTFPSGPVRIFADYDPSTGMEVENSQFTVLTACIYEPTIPHGPSDRVYWTYEDVDDPSADLTIDPMGSAGNDNLGQFDGSAPFSGESGFPLTIGAPGPYQYGTDYGIVPPGVVCSKIRFHPTDAPGDNFTVTARLSSKVGEQLVSSTVMTVWKRVHVELDSMGEVEGHVDADDAVVGDVPDPLPEFLATAFKPAYIEILNDGAGTTTNVEFDPHVPDIFANTPNTSIVDQINNQGGLGRESSSSTGAWRLYAHGGYESYVDKDFDGETSATWGITNLLLGKFSLVFAETIRDYGDFSLIIDENYLWKVLTLHELGHQFRLEEEVVTSDGSGGVMEEKSFYMYPYFNAEHLRKIRCIGQVICGEQPSEFPSKLE